MNKPFNYGGQAVIEGVMMRGRKHVAIAVRNPQGEIVLHTEPLNPRIYSSFINKVPFLRGFTLLWDALVLGMQALMFSAEVALVEEQAAPDQKKTEFAGPVAWGTVAFSLVMVIAIFFVGPLLLIDLLERLVISLPIWGQHVIEGTVRLLLFLGYIWLISFMEDIKRVFAYHGAEHKTINAYEQDVELTPKQVAQCSLLHPRCGTAFLLIVMIISIFVFALVGNPALWLKIVSRIILIPVIAGIAYEFLKFSAAHQQQPIIKVLIAPGLALQRMTTREPDLSMLEVAITALKKLLAEERLALEMDEAETGEALPVSEAV